MKNKLKFLILIFSLITFVSGSAQVSTKANMVEQHWVDSVYNALTPQQRIGQLFILRANSDIDSLEIHQLTRLIKEYNIGGLCFFKGGPVRQAILTNYYQKLARTPLLISMDAEWGLGMRLDSTISFARQMTMGAIKNEQLITEYGLAIAAQLRRMGVHVSFSPVADINSNPANPVINIRSFGEQKEDVARKSVLYMKALQQGGIISVAKHFPGHGDTDTDSHHSLPFIGHSATTIDSLDIYPFRQLINAGIDGIMVAHLNIPALDATKDIPSSLSPIAIDSLLRKNLKFNGLVFSDALDMKGVSSYNGPGSVELKALKAGNDVLLLSVSVDKAVAEIMQAIDSGFYSKDELAVHCKKILDSKYRSGLNRFQPVQIINLYTDLHLPEEVNLNLELYRNAITVLKNDDNIIPILTSDTLQIASLMIGYPDIRMFQQRINDYAKVDHYTLPRNFDKSTADATIKYLKDYDLVIIGINNTIPAPARNFGISDESIGLVDSLLVSKSGILNMFTIPYSINLFREIDKAKAVVVAYQDNADAYDAVVQMMFGATAANGILPVGVNSAFPTHAGLTTTTSGRLSYNPYQNKEIHSEDIALIDSIVKTGLDKKAYPGCQVLIAKNGDVIYRKSFGNTDYIHNQPVKNDDLYDIASVTKVAATTLAVMKLYDEGKVNLDEPLSKTLKYLENSNKKKITIREVMTHQAGLVAWIPFYQKTMKNGYQDSSLYRTIVSDNFPYRVAEGMFLRKDYRKIIFDSIIRSPLSDKKEYKYSDLGFILMQQFVEQVTGKSLDEYLDQQFYKPLGLKKLTFHPRDKFPLSRIIPTENDTLFRHQLVQGDVHDQAAALLGGVAGHAGLFGTSNDMAVILQMLIQNGSYGGRQYIKPETVALFTKRQFKGNRRGLGFDKPQLVPSEPGPACEEASANSYGHTGFTGTYIWADPDNDLSIVFLSNRVNPDAEPNKLVQLGIRTQIQQTLYRALNKNLKHGQQNLRKPVNTTE
ncbi:MAG: glycoside hydrolase family 3 N-terminal domain-containing protein [Bacteroidales bacterium]|nr:glycoside hydrolase family 3 N-terminal domain-containing protein [Bacteroidales bacterium]